MKGRREEGREKKGKKELRGLLNVTDRDERALGTLAKVQKRRSWDDS